MEVAALVISILAILIAGASALYARQQAHGTTAQAQEAKRANDRLDEIDKDSAEAAEREAEAHRVVWKLQPHGRNHWVLSNVGREPARDVRLTVEGGILRAEAEVVGDGYVLPEIKPNRPVTLTVVQTPDMTSPGPAVLTIARDGEQEAEMFPLPA